MSGNCRITWWSDARSGMVNHKLIKLAKLANARAKKKRKCKYKKGFEHLCKSTNYLGQAKEETHVFMEHKMREIGFVCFYARKTRSPLFWRLFCLRESFIRARWNWRERLLVPFAEFLQSGEMFLQGRALCTTVSTTGFGMHWLIFRDTRPDSNKDEVLLFFFLFIGLMWYVSSPNQRTTPWNKCRSLVVHVHAELVSRCTTLSVC